MSACCRGGCVSSHDQSDGPGHGGRQQAFLLRATREWRQTLDGLRDAVCLIDPQGRILRCNRAMQRLLNRSFDRITGQSCWQLIYGQDEPPAHCDLIGRAASEGVVPEVSFSQCFHEKWYDITLLPVTDDNGQVLGAVYVMADISEIRDAERALSQYAARLRMVHEIDQSVLDLKHPEKVAQDVLQRLGWLAPFVVASVTLFDFSHGDAVLYVVTNAHPQDTEGGRIPADAAWVERLRVGEICTVPDIRLLLPPSRWAQSANGLGIASSVAVPLKAAGELIGSLNLGLATDEALPPAQSEIIEQVAVSLAVALQNSHLFESVKEQRQLLRSLGSRMTSVEEEQRRRLARELHDRVGQILTAIGINLNYVRSILGDESPALLERLDESLDQVEQVSDRIRDVMSELRPMVLDDYGLPGALQWYGEQFARRTGIKVRVREEAALPRLSREVETALFRIAEEAFTNISKHAHADVVEVTLGSIDSSYTMKISDDGLGFDVASKTERPGQTGWGLMSMQERAMSVGACVDFVSRPKGGTTIEVREMLSDE